MKLIYSSVLAFTTILASHAFAGSVSGGGGGGTLPADPVSAYKIYDIITEAKVDLSLFLKSELYRKHQSSHHDPLTEKLFGGPKTLYDALKTTDVEIRMTEPCYDVDHNPVDGSIYATKPGDICISAATIAPKVIEERAYVETLALILHELAHTLGADENEASEYQRWVAYQLKSHYRGKGNTVAERAQDRASRLGYMIRDLSQKFEHLPPEDLNTAITTLDQKLSEFSDMNQLDEFHFTFMLGDHLEMDWYEVQETRFKLATLYLMSEYREAYRTIYEKAFRGSDSLPFANLDYPLPRNDRNLFKQTIIRKLKNSDEAKRELQELSDYFARESTRLFALKFGYIGPAEPNYPHETHPNPWTNFIGSYSILSAKCTTSTGKVTSSDLKAIQLYKDEQGQLWLKEIGQNWSSISGMYQGAYTYNGAELRVSGDQNTALAQSESGDKWSDRFSWRQHVTEITRRDGTFQLTKTLKDQRRSMEGKTETWSQCQYQIAADAR